MPLTRRKTAEAAAVEAQEIADGEAVEQQLQCSNSDQSDKSAKSDSEAEVLEVHKSLTDLSEEDQLFLINTEKELAGRFGNVEETAPALASLKAAVAYMCRIRDYRAKYASTEQISCISFSRLGEKDLPSIGVAGLTGPVGAESAYLKLKDSSALGGGISAVDGFATEWTTRGKDLFAELKFYTESTNDKSEMTSRTIVDSLLSLLRHVGSASKSQITVHPEMEVGYAKGLGVPIHTYSESAEGDEKATQTVFLTGYLDWGVFSRGAGAEPKDEALRKELHAKIVACSDLQGLVGISAYLRRPGSGNMLCQFMVVEAKNVSLFLALHLPQVLGQSVATCQARRVKYTAWILTNGWSWIFGVTRNKNFAPNPNPDSREHHKFDYLRTTVIMLDLLCEYSCSSQETLFHLLANRAGDVGR